MSTIASLEPPAPADLAPNTDTARQKAWRAEIHTPDAEYNANVPIDEIERDPANRMPSADDVAARAASIEKLGLLQPVVLRLVGPGKYRLMAGETRWLAMQKLGRKTIAARIYKDQSEVDAAAKALAENAQRSDLTAIERAKRFRQLEELGMKQKEIGALAGGVSQPVVANALRLLELPTDVQELVNDGMLSEAHGVALARFAKWPRACSCIARMAKAHDYSAKSLNQEGLPFAGQLVQERAVEKIQIQERYYSDGVIYKLPKQLASHRDFFVSQYHAYYFTPANPKDDIWGPEKRRQDEERTKQEAAAAARESKQKASGKLTAEQVQRKKTIEKNKRQRAENAAGLLLAIAKLKQTSEPTVLLVAILAEAAIAGGFGAKRLSEAAEAVGVRLPPGVISINGGHGLRNVDALVKMAAVDLARFAVAILIVKEIDDANRNAWPLPKNVERVMNSKVTKIPPAPDSLKKLGKGGAS